jgi:transglutaminase-like putative cysteine protease
MELQDANPDAQGEGSDALTRANQPRMSFDGERREGRGASVAAVVVFSDDYHTPSGYYYFRQQAHSELIGARLVPTTRDDADLDVEKEYPTEITPVREPPPWGERRRVRARVALLGEHDGPIALESPALFLPSENPDPDLFHTAYRFESYAQEIPYEELVGRTAGDPDWSEELRAYYLQTPDDPRYAALVEEVLATLPDAARQDPFTRALALKVHLDETMTYSLAARYPSATDPTAAFLFGDRIGYCVHSAHAAVYLWRLAGVPARVGTGYLVDETAREGAALTIMGSDAHAWPEMYLDGLGWIPVDVTPANTMDQPGQPPDGDLTRALGEIVRRASNEPEEEQERLPLGLWLRRILIGWAIAAVVSVFAAHHVVKGYRRLRPLLARPKAVPRVAYRAVLDQLTEAGLGREEGESREAHARRIEAIVPSFATLTAMHVAAKYGNPNTPLDRRPEFDVARWREARIAFRRELSAHTPGWRRLFGLVDPTTLYRTR